MLIGLIGKANTGKSTFFKALTLAEISIAPYPFTTIEKNEGVAYVKAKCPETEFKVKCRPKHGHCIGGDRFVPVKVIDVAGLVPEAHKGKGKGNKFLDDLSEADLLIHVLDASGTSDEHGNPTENYNIANDVKFLQEEIDLWLYSIINRDWKSFAKKTQADGKLSEILAEKLSGLKINENVIVEAIKALNLSEKAGEWAETEVLNFVKKIRELSKPIIIAANKADRPESFDNLEKLKKEFPGLLIIPCSAESELALKEAEKDKLIRYIPGNSDFEILYNEKLSEQQKKALEFIRKNVLGRYGSTGVQECLNKAVFEFLKYIAVYPVENENHLSDKQGNVLPDVFLLPDKTSALDLAFAIHTDIGKSFISAINCKTKKRLAKTSELKDSDVIKIMAK